MPEKKTAVLGSPVRIDNQHEGLSMKPSGGTKREYRRSTLFFFMSIFVCCSFSTASAQLSQEFRNNLQKQYESGYIPDPPGNMSYEERLAIKKKQQMLEANKQKQALRPPPRPQGKSRSIALPAIKGMEDPATPTTAPIDTVGINGMRAAGNFQDAWKVILIRSAEIVMTRAITTETGGSA